MENKGTRIRIEKAADLEDMWGGQTEFEWAVYLEGPGEFEILGAGHTCRQAVAEARATLRTWRTNAWRTNAGLNRFGQGPWAS